MRRGITATGLTMVVGLLAMMAPSAIADAQGDYATIRNDWYADGQITHCKYTLTQLQNARAVSQQTSGDAYTDFPSVLDKEIADVKAGKCPPGTPGARNNTPPPAKPGSRLRLTVTPRSAKVGVKTTFRFKVTAPRRNGRGRTSVKNARITFGGRSVLTKSNGRAQLKLTFTRAGRRTATATKRGLKAARVRITVRA